MFLYGGRPCLLIFFSQVVRSFHTFIKYVFLSRVCYNLFVETYINQIEIRNQCYKLGEIMKSKFFHVISKIRILCPTLYAGEIGTTNREPSYFYRGS